MKKIVDHKDGDVIFIEGTPYVIASIKGGGFIIITARAFSPAGFDLEPLTINLRHASAPRKNEVGYRG